MSPDEAKSIARSFALENFVIPAFFNRLATVHNVRPASQEEGLRLWKMASQLCAMDAEGLLRDEPEQPGHTVMDVAEAAIKKASVPDPASAEQQRLAVLTDILSKNAAALDAMVACAVADASEMAGS